MLGLPDLAPLQKAVLDRVETQMLDAVTSLSPEGILKTWLGAIPAMSEQYARVFGGLMGAAAKRTASGQDE